MPADIFLLDTDIVSFIGCQRPPAGLREWLTELGSARLAISFPTIAELRRGAHLIKETNPAKSAAISVWVDEVLQTDLHFLAMTPQVAAVYARMTATPGLRSMWTVQRGEKHNRLGHDLMIASVAIAHGTPIMTGNTRDYMRVHELFPLPGIFHPLGQKWFVKPVREIELPPWEGCAHFVTIGLPKIRADEHPVVRRRHACAGRDPYCRQTAAARNLASPRPVAVEIDAVAV